MTALSLVTVLAVMPAPQDSDSFRLDNGMQVILERVEAHGIAAVGLAYRAGVFDEPEGWCGISHLLEHLFVQGPTESFPTPFETLSRDGPLGQPYMDVNAETMWSLTYVYALRPAPAVEEALQVFAEKMDHPALTQALLDRERPRVLQELRSVAQLMDSNPALRMRLEAHNRYPKAGIEEHIEALTLQQLDAYRTNSYRPDRAVLVVYGAIDLEETREMIETLFAPLQAREPQPLEPAQREGLPTWQIETHPCEDATQSERDALGVFAAAWQQKLRRHGRAYVELPGDGSMRAVLLGDDAAPIAETRKALLEGLSEGDLSAARRAAMALVRRGTSDPRQLNTRADLATYAPILGQAVVDRLLFEVEGGERLLDALDSITADEVRAAANTYLR